MYILYRWRQRQIEETLVVKWRISSMVYVSSNHHIVVNKSMKGKAKLSGREKNRVGWELNATNNRMWDRGTKAQSSLAIPG